MLVPAAALEDAVERSAAPAVVRLVLERLVAASPAAGARLAADAVLAEAVVAVVAASGSLARLLETDPAAIEVLADLDRRIDPPGEAEPDGLAYWKRRELLRIAARDLLGRDDLSHTAHALATMAADVFDRATDIAGAHGIAVIGMGKLGGAELNYASDVDVMLVGDDERPARELLDVARRCFRVDLNLRPEGRDGAVVRSLESYESYWARWAQPWEFQALLKAAPVAGDPDLGARFATAAAEHLWSRPFTADDIRAVRELKSRSELAAARRGDAGRDVKQGPGGIRDIEFSVQLLQLVHGGVDAELRSPNTLDALGELADAGYVDRHDADQLGAAYRYLRRVEHALQLVEEQQVHSLPTNRAALDRLARVLGHRPSAAVSAIDALLGELRAHQGAVRAIHERLYFRPLLEAFAEQPGTVIGPDAAAARLAAFGFTDVARTRQAVAELTRGLTRSSRLMQQLLPLLLDWLSQSPDPDIGLLGLRKLASGPQRSMELANAFRDSPEVARQLCCILGTSRLLTDHLQRQPDLIATLTDGDDARLRPRDEGVVHARAAVGWRGDMAERQAALKRFTDREGLRIAAADVLGRADTRAVGRALTGLAESALTVALDTLQPPIPFAVVAMGRLGGEELSYASDLDVVFVYEGDSPDDFAAAEQAATGILRFLGAATPVIYDVDADLRPEGRDGALARSVEAYRTYFDRWAEPWERLAMVRARPAAGDLDLAGRLLDEIAPLVWQDGLSDAERREIRRIKARVERERIPTNEDPQFHLKLGRGSLSDIEFCVQLLQLEHGIRSPSTVGALDLLHDAGVLDEEEHQVLADAYGFCEQTRNRWFLVNSGPGDSLPQDNERLSRLARSLDTTAGELRDEYRRVTRRARRVVEQRFYGQD